MRIQFVRRRRTSASTAAARTLPIRTMGRSGPSPPPLVEPLNALNTLAAGDDPPLADAAETDEAGPVELGRADGRGRDGAVASASAAAATPAGPCAASACWVEAGIAPPPPALPPPPPPPPPLEVPPGPPGWPRSRPRGARYLSAARRPRSGPSRRTGLRRSSPAGQACDRTPQPRLERQQAGPAQSQRASRIRHTFDGRAG